MIDVILWAIVGAISGIIFGIIPGSSAFFAVATFYPFLVGELPVNILSYYVGLLITAFFTNSVTAILYGIPGDASAIPTAKYGHQLFLKGYGSLAVSSNAISSSVGVLFALASFILILPNIIHVFKFYNSVVQTIVLCGALILIIFFQKQNKIISILLLTFGGFLGKIGFDNVTMESHFTFNINYLTLGIPFSSVMIGLYIVPEILKIQKINLSDQKYSHKIAVGKGIVKSSITGSIIGFWCGLIPGVTNILGSYVSSKIFNKRLDKISAAEAANNSGGLSCLLPLLILGIPIVGSEVLIYYLMTGSGHNFSIQTTINSFHEIIYIVPFITISAFFISWIGFSYLCKIVVFYKKYKTYANIFLLMFISLLSINMYPVNEWIILAIICLSVIGFLIQKVDTSPIIYGYFLSDLFYQNLNRTLIIMEII